MSMMLDRLEERTLLSATLDHTDGVLTIDGTNRNDQMTVSVNKKHKDTLDVNVNRTLTQFKIKGVKQIRMFGLGGNDTMKADQRNGRITLPVIMDGGKGNDKLQAGDGNAVLNGGDGDDTLVGGAGSNNIDGGPGDDCIYGGTRKNVFHYEHDKFDEIKNYHVEDDRYE